MPAASENLQLQGHLLLRLPGVFSEAFCVGVDTGLGDL